MPAFVKHKEDYIAIKQYLTDAKGDKMAAVIDIDELKRLETVLDLISASEQWLYRNKKALESVQRGLTGYQRKGYQAQSQRDLGSPPYCGSDETLITVIAIQVLHFLIELGINSMSIFWRFGCCKEAEKAQSHDGRRLTENGIMRYCLI